MGSGCRRTPRARRSAGHTTMMTGNTASGRRLGLIAIAIPAAAPDAAAFAFDSALDARGTAVRHASSSDAVQNVAAGTSLIGHSVRNRTVGLLATRSAATA